MQTLEIPNRAVLLDLPVAITAEFDSTKMSLREMLRLRVGSVIQLEQTADSPASLFANQKLIGRGQVVVSGNKLAIQVEELIGARR